MARFADINVSQGSVATYAWCGGILNIRLTTNLPTNLRDLKKIGSDLTELWPRVCGRTFFGPPCRVIRRCCDALPIQRPFELSASVMQNNANCVGSD